MPARLKIIFLLSLAISFVFRTTPTDIEEISTTDTEESTTTDDEEMKSRGFAEYETWKPSHHHATESSAPEVILIKQKDPHSDHHSDIMSSFHSTIKHHLPLLAVLAPLVAISVLLPLKAYLGPSYVIYPPVTTAAPPPDSKKDRIGKAEEEAASHSLALQVMNMIDKVDKFYEDMAVKEKKS